MPPTLTELYLAYRQAKTAHYYEKRGVGLLSLARFESQLRRRLTRLQSFLRDNGGWFDNIPLGEVWLVPKRRRQPDSTNQNKVIRIGEVATPESSGLDVQLRLTPTPEFAIVEVLFLWQFGPALDALLSPNALGYRLDARDGQLGKTRRWLFEFWPARYQEYRTAPLEAARRELQRPNSAVVILSADFASFYDTIDPSFLVLPSFIRQLFGSTVRDEPAGAVADYLVAARSLLSAYESFRRIAAQRTGLTWQTGVPIGPLTSRIVANLSLEPLDRAISSQTNLLCYRRYVDDLVIVSKASREDRATSEEILSRCIPYAREVDGTFRFDLEALDRTGSDFELQKTKIRVHHLSGLQGEDFLSAIEADFQTLVSGRRSFLDTSVLLEDALTQFISAGKRDGTPLRVLRDADRSKLQHFALSNTLRSIERVSVMVDPEEARKFAGRTLEKVVRFLTGEDDWVANLELAFRILRLAVVTQDREELRKLNQSMDTVWGSVHQLKASVGFLYHRDRKISTASAWTWLRNYLHARRLEAVCGALRPSAAASTAPDLLEGGLIIRTRPVSTETLRSQATLLANADLRMRDREDDAFDSRPNDWGRTDRFLIDRFDSELKSRMSVIGRFIERCQKLGDLPWQMAPTHLFLCTRPPSYFDIARRWLYRVESYGFASEIFQELLDIVNAVRGTSYRDPVGRVLTNRTVEIPAEGSENQEINNPEDPKVILGNLVVRDEAFKSAATRVRGSLFGRPSLTPQRLIGLATVLDRARDIAKAKAPNGKIRAAVLVLPELSIPRQWFRIVANHVAQVGAFGLVAGLEYLHSRNRRVVLNQAYAVLPGPFSSVATWPWTKRFPAREEREQLLRLRVRFPPLRNPERGRIVVRSPYGLFSVLICSEMIESRRTADLLGRVEVVLVPSWNPDTASYDHLIQSVGLQLHAIVAVANNGHYSDCRAWAPQTERWRRDLCRLVERDSDNVVFGDIPLSSLRAFRASAPAPPTNPSPRSGASRPVNLPEWRPLPPDWP